LVVEPSALAQTFLQSDLTGTWRLHSKSVPKLAGQTGGWAVGSVTFDAGGNQTGSLTLNDGTPVTITGGTNLVNSGGVITGTQTNTGSITASVTGAMASSKDQTWAVVTVRDSNGNPVTVNLASLIKQNVTTFANADLAGTWRSFRLVSQSNGNSVWVTGVHTLNSSGTVTSGSLTFSTGSPVNLDAGTAFSLDANGLLTGTDSNNSGATTRAYQGTMAPTKDRMVAVFTVNPGAVAFGMAIFVKETATSFATADLGANWRIHALAAPTLPPANEETLWLSGLFPFTSGGIMTDGNGILSDGEGAGPFQTSGALSVSANGTFTGTLSLSDFGSTILFPTQGMLVPGKDQAFGVFSVNDPTSPFTQIALFALVKDVGSNPTLAVAKVGAGSGTVASDQGGFICGNDCAESYGSGTSVLLTATPAVNSTFAAFGGCDSTTTSTCTINSLLVTRYVAAAFGPTPRFRFIFSYFGGGTVPSGGGAGAITFPVPLAGYFPQFCVRDDPAPPGGVTFTGPAGSFLSNTTSTQFFPFNEEAGGCYQSDFISSTTNPPGGTYTTEYNGQPRPLNVPAPDTANRKVVLLPTVTVTGGNLTSVSWVYKDATTGATLGGPPSFVAKVQINVQDLSNNQLYFSTDLLPTGSPHTLTSTVNWNNVGSVGLQYTDTLDNTYFIGFNRAVAVPLAVAISGSGSVTSNPAGINCGILNGGTCNFNFTNGTSVGLTAAPGTGATFTGWGGSCAGAGSNLNAFVFMNGPQGCVATFTATSTNQLGVTIAGSGGGTVTSSPAGITCSSGSCLAQFAHNQVVTLTPAPNQGSTFAGWSLSCAGNGQVQVTMDINKSCTATFNAGGGPSTFTLTVNLLGSGGGTVTSSPPGINCPGTCQFAFNANQSVQLSQTPNQGSTFAGWGGNCDVNGGILMTGDLTCTATFNTTQSAKLIAISTRSSVQAVNQDQEPNAMIAGFSVSGSQGTQKTLVIRARGPSLTAFGVQGALSDPFLKVLSGQTTLAQNDDWQVADPTCQNTGNQCGTAADITGVGLSPCSPNVAGCEKEAAIYITLPPGTYTAIARGASGSPGIGIVEVYEVDASSAKLVAISTRGVVQAVSLDQEANAMIAGFSVGGSPGTFKTVIIRVRGPSLSAFGVQGVLTDPFVKVLSGQTTLAQNDDWQVADPTCQNTGNQCGTAIDITNAGLSPCSPNVAGCEKEAAIQIRLPPGAYTAIARGASGSPGIGIVEVYDVGN